MNESISQSINQFNSFPDKGKINGDKRIRRRDTVAATAILNK